MVTRNGERRNQPEYSLQRVRELARTGSVDYGSRRVVRHVENLGYAPEDVCRCLAGLEAGHYRESIRYRENGPWLDVYLITCTGPAGHADSLYIKLKLNRDCIVVVLESFHPEGWI